MAIKTKRAGAWVTPGSGTIRVKSGGVWTTVTALSMKSGGVWRSSGYVGFPGQPGNFRSTNDGNGDNKQVAFAWDVPSSGATVTGYRFRTYNSAFTQLTSTDVSAATLTRTVTFSGSAGTVLYADVAALGAAGEGTKSIRKKVTLGAASYSTDNYGYTSTIDYKTMNGYNSSSNWGGSSVGYAADGDIFSYWSPQGHVAAGDASCYEGLIMTSGLGRDPYFNQPRKLHSVRWWTNHDQYVWVGLWTNGGWQGGNWISGVYGSQAGYIQDRPYVGIHGPGSGFGIDGFRFMDFGPLGLGVENIGAVTDLIAITCGPNFPYTDEGAGWGVPYKPHINTVDIGFRSYGVTGTTPHAATANTVVTG